MKSRFRLFLVLAISFCAAGAVPVHTNMGRVTLLGYIADSLSLAARGAATLPTAPPVHRNMGETQLLGYIADYAQELNEYTISPAADEETDMRAAIQAAMDTVYAAGGGTVRLKEGVYFIQPTAGGIGLLARTGVWLRGAGPGTVIRAGAGTAPFELIAGYGYNTCTTQLGAEEILISDLKLESADLTDTDCHGLLGIVHSPRSIVERVTFGNAYYHAVEWNKCANSTLVDCRFTGQSESSFLQFDDGGNAGQMSTNATAGALSLISNVRLVRCHIAARSLSAAALSANPRQVELSHSTTVRIEGLVFEGCSFGPCYTTGTSACYTVAYNSVPARVRGLEFRNCRFYGETVGVTQGLMLGGGAPADGIEGTIIDGCYFGPGYDISGRKCAGGWAYACSPNVSRSYSQVSGATGYNTGYAAVRGTRVTNCHFEQSYEAGACTASFTASSVLLPICSLQSCTVENNYLTSAAAVGTLGSINVASGVHTMVTAESIKSLTFRGNQLYFRGTPGSGGMPTAGSNVGVAFTQIKMATDAIPSHWLILSNIIESSYTGGNAAAYGFKEFGSYATTNTKGRYTGNVVTTLLTAPSIWTSNSAWVLD